MSNFHCRCGLESADCLYPKCVSGDQDKKDNPEYHWVCSGSGEEVLIQPDGKVLARIRQVEYSNIYQVGKDQYYGIDKAKRAAEQKLFGGK